MRAICLLYHDVVEFSNWNSSGFTGPGTSRYKLDRIEFEAHLAGVAGFRPDSPQLVPPLAVANGSIPFLLTFDDGGESAFTTIAPILGKHQWRGHFFVTAGQIGNKGFLNPEQIRALRNDGHIIGSHSFSHPVRMSSCSDHDLFQEWSKSVRILSEILNEPIETASVPGGYYSDRVAEIASEAGIRFLFNSEPTTVIRTVRGCQVAGRYNLFRDMQPQRSAQLVSARSRARSLHWVSWNFKKLAKTIAGRPYLAARQWLLRNE